VTVTIPGGTLTSNVPFRVLPKTQSVTTTKLTTSGSPSLLNQPVTFTATITSSGGSVPDGEAIAFYDGATQIGLGSTATGAATFTTSSLSAKTHTIKAIYAGDTAFKTSSGTVKQIVELSPTTTSLSSSANPSNFGQSVTLTAVVANSGGPTPTGTVTFKNGTATLGSATLDSTGTATLATTKLPLGSDSLTADYNGDSQNQKSDSSVLMQTVNQAQITLSLASSPNPSSSGKPVKFTATLTSNGGLPSGQPVTFSYNGTTLGTANVNAKGVATFLTTTLPHGSDVVTGAYAGTVDYSSASATVTQVVN
jgi:Bacterial Ig-like domain (group 3)